MSLPLPSPVKPVIDYPESDGQPMADNTRQLQWIVVLFGNLAALYRNDQNVFVLSNQNWYPIEGEPSICVAPDVYAVFGRPKGHRGSYQQWEEGGVPMTVVFEVLSPRNTPTELENKYIFYEEHGVEEYYIYDPDKNTLEIYLRRGTALRRHWAVDGFISPRLGIRFQMTEPEMTVFLPDGQRFLTFEEMRSELSRSWQERDAARQEAEQARQQAEQQVEQARQQAEQARQQAERMQQRVARLTELSRKARRGQATPEELDELDRLEDPRPPT